MKNLSGSVLLVLLVLLPQCVTGSSCFSIKNCTDCLNAYTCHWCDFDQACHAKGSVHGCKWGSSCQPPKPTGCAAHTTCSECALSSHACHWCEFDNACHAVTSPFGCKTGVDCYSNERCRRSEPEKFEKVVLTEMPYAYLISLLIIGSILIGCLTCCYGFVGNLRGAYNDLATLAASASPPSMIGGTMTGMMSEPFYSALATQPEEEEEATEENAPTQQVDEEANQEQTTGNQESIQETHPPDASGLEVDDPLNENPSQQRNESYDAVPEIQESSHVKSLYRTCSIFYYFFVFVVILLSAIVIYFYPVEPYYSVCNDAVGWGDIIRNIIFLRVDASFEILVSLSNPNRIAVALDQGTGTFTFKGEPLGTFMIPPFTAGDMAVTDLMLIAHATPNRKQAYEILNAYMGGSLVLEAEFDATVRVPSFFNYSRNLTVTNIPVDVTALADRKLCHCPSWDDTNHSSPLLMLS
eukprot:scaffold5159_cov112-Cylindrotheca_fusiformis.AAC.20